MSMPFTQRISGFVNGEEEEQRVDPDEEQIAHDLENAGADTDQADRLAQQISDLILYAKQVGRQEAELGSDDEDNAVLYAIIATALFSAANAAMLFHVHFMG